MDARRMDFPSNGGTTPGFLAVPEGEKGPGVIVLQEWWGLVPHIEDVCRRFAREGFVALAPDLYHGETTRSPDDAGKLMMALDIARTERDLRGAVSYLKALPATTSQGVGIVGFCMGGQLALYGASTNPDIRACVNYYGIHPQVKPDLGALAGPVLAFFAEKDGFVTPVVARGLEEALQDAGKQVEIHIYPGTQHAFFNDTRPEVYDARAAADSWIRMLGFFGKHVT